MTHFLVLLSILHVSLELKGGSLGAMVDAMGPGSVLEEDVVAIGVAGTDVLLIASCGGTFIGKYQMQEFQNTPKHP